MSRTLSFFLVFVILLASGSAASLLQKQRVGDVAYLTVDENIGTFKVLRYSLGTDSWLPSFSLPAQPVQFHADGSHLYFAHSKEVWRRNPDGSDPVKVFTATDAIIGLVGDSSFLMVVEAGATARITSIRKSDTVIAGVLNNAGVVGSFAIAPNNRKVYGTRQSYPIDGLAEISYNVDGSFGASTTRAYSNRSTWWYATSVAYVLPSEAKVIHGDQFSVYSTPGLSSVSDVRFSFSDADFVAGDNGIVRSGNWFLAVDSSLKAVGAISADDYAFAMVRGTDVFLFSQDYGQPGSVIKIPRASIVSPAGEAAAPLNQTGSSPIRIVEAGTDKLAIISGEDAYLYSGAAKGFIASTKLWGATVSASYSPQNNRIYVSHYSGLVTQLTPEAASFRPSVFTTTSSYQANAFHAGARVVVVGESGPAEVLDSAGNLLAVSETSLAGLYAPAYWNDTASRLTFLKNYYGLPYQAAVSGSGTISMPASFGTSNNLQGVLRGNDTGTRAIATSSGHIINPSSLSEIGRLPAPIIDACWNGEVLNTVRLVNDVGEFNVWNSDLTVQKSITLPGNPYAVFKLSNGSFLVPSYLSGRLFFSYVNPSTGAVGSSPLFKAEPFSQSVVSGGSTFFEASLESGTATYQWYKDGIAISGATSSVLAFSPATGSDSGAYYVVATNAFGSVTSRTANLSVYVPPPAILSQTYTVTATVGARASLSITADSTATRYEWYKLGVAGPVGSGATLVFDPVQVSNAGYFYCRAYNAYGYFGSSYWLTLTVGNAPLPTPDIVLITGGLKSQTVTPGSSVTLSVTASGTNLTYAWTRNGVTLAEAGPTLTIPNAQPSDAGTYEVTVRNGTGSQAVSNSTLTIKPKANISNISTRMHVDTGSNIAVAGFVIEGGASKRVLIRAAGPALSQFIGAGAMSDPKLEVYNSSQVLLASNNDWDFALNAEFANAGAFGWAKDSKDAALVLTLAPGSYTAQVSIQSGLPGTALVEVYDLEPEGAGRLANISTRAVVSSPTDVIIAGFVVSGESEKAVLIRGAGPALSQFSLQGVLNDPKLSIFDSKGNEVAKNSSWTNELSTVFDAVGAFKWPAASKDAAIQVSLKPGSYTVHLQSEDGGTGIAIVEVYEMK